jgi:hypothetical protein
LALRPVTSAPPLVSTTLEHTGDVTAPLAHIEEGNENGSDTNEVEDNNADEEKMPPPLELIDPPAVTPLHDDDDCPDLVPQGNNNNDDDDSVSEGSYDSASNFDDDDFNDDLNDAVFDLERPESTPTPWLFLHNQPMSAATVVPENLTLVMPIRHAAMNGKSTLGLEIKT